MANEKTPVVWDDTTNKHRPLGTGEKMGGLDASSLLSSDSGNLLEAGSDGLAYLSGSGMVDPRADNLLEESDRGKLQVTVDRIAEWLDGHPQDAAILADAINVVSGDSGNVIVEGSDKGAFLSKGAIAAAVAGMTDAQKNQLADAIAARIASDIADGKTIVASNGKLTSDPTNATVAQKKAINQALADADSGLVVDNSTGKLKVDFSNMPTDKFEALLAGLKMQVPLSANLALHVDNSSEAAGDDIVDGRGTAAKPFRTIQACVEWAAGYYSLGQYSILIHVHAGNGYTETLRLPAYNASSGKFVIRAADYAEPPLVLVSNTIATNVVCTGGRWDLVRLRLVNNPSVAGVTRIRYPRCLDVSESGAHVYVYGCEFDYSYYGASTTYLHGALVGVGSGAWITFYPMATYPTKLTYHMGNSNWLKVLVAGSGGTIAFNGAYGELAYAVQCQGDCSIFAGCESDSKMQLSGAGDDYPHFVVASGQTCTGVKYAVTDGSFIRAPSGGFPGSSDGSVEAATYCWYEEVGA